MLENCTVREAEKSKAYLREFRREMEKHDEELKVFRQKKGEEFAKNQEKSAATFKKLSCELPDGKGGRLVVQRQQDHPLFKQAEAIMEDHQSLLKQFQLVEEQLDAKKLDLPVSRWEQDNREIRELLAYSGKYGEDLVGSVLAPERVATPFDPSCTDETQRVLKELFKDSQGALDGETWGQVAEEQLKQFSIVARTARLGERW
ncbi:hypothetical protein F4802DRAFT_110409 [Xylaria palmicola]|nr:hypothetical protein F4802DRAFT_110409 [Xylaria palmicola]